MTPLSVLTGMDKGISAEVNGQKNQEISVGDKVEADNVNGGVNTYNSQEVPIEFMLLMIVGWLAPSPQEMWRGLLKLLPWVKT